MIKEQRKAIEICKEKIIEPFYDFPNPTSIEIKDTDVRVIEIVLSLIKEQEKQIDLMAEYIDEIDVSEDICEEKTMCDENCKDCVKQYFADKAKIE